MPCQVVLFLVRLDGARMSVPGLVAHLGALQLREELLAPVARLRGDVGEHRGLRHVARIAIERVSLCGDEKLTAFLELAWPIRD